MTDRLSSHVADHSQDFGYGYYADHAVSYSIVYTTIGQMINGPALTPLSINTLAIWCFPMPVDCLLWTLTGPYLRLFSHDTLNLKSEHVHYNSYTHMGLSVCCVCCPRTCIDSLYRGTRVERRCEGVCLLSSLTLLSVSLQSVSTARRSSRVCPRLAAACAGVPGSGQVKGECRGRGPPSPGAGHRSGSKGISRDVIITRGLWI